MFASSEIKMLNDEGFIILKINFHIDSLAAFFFLSYRAIISTFL